MTDNCPVCSSLLLETAAPQTSRDAISFVCRRCGSFTLSGSLYASLPAILLREKDRESKLSFAIRRAQKADGSVEFNSDTIEAVFRQKLPRPREQADLLIRWLAENVSAPGEQVWIEPATHMSVIGSKTPNGFGLVVDHLFDTGLLTGALAKSLSVPGRAHATLSFAGWEFYEKLKIGFGEYRKAFMAMKFGNAQLDLLLEEVFKPSVKRAGFDLIKLNDVPRAGLIDDRLRVEIQASDFVVADLSHDNLGAYWEAGYAEGLGKPVIYTCEKSKFEETKTHFDTNHHLTIIWDDANREQSGKDLAATIRATLPHIANQRDD